MPNTNLKIRGIPLPPSCKRQGLKQAAALLFFFLFAFSTFNIYGQCCQVCKKTLVSNGDFAACNTGYSSDLAFVNCNVNPGGLGWWSGTRGQDPTMDHTPGGGTMSLTVDCFFSSLQRVWYRNVSVQAGKTYCFTAWVKDFNGICGFAGGSIDLKIGGINGTVLQSLTFGTNTNWVQMCGTYTTTANATIELDVVADVKLGMQFYVDDISFSEQSAPDPDFSYSGVPCGNPASFTSFDTEPNTTHSWTFGDNTGTNTSANPTHNYTANGTYQVTHKVTNPCGTATETKTIVIDNPSITPDFTISGIPCGNPAVFTSIETSTTVSHFWDFGDGNTSTSANPSHSYAPGTYTVKHTVTSPCRTESTTQTITIIAGTPVDAEFAMSVPLCGQSAQFSPGNNTGVISHFWDFGDGSTSTAASPSYKYPNSGGSYTVTHIVVGDCVTDTVIHTINTPNCCCKDNCGTSLVTNGKFDAANCFTSYSSSYVQLNCQNPAAVGAGYYTETSDASAWGSNLLAADNSGSRMILFRSATNKRKLWSQNVTVEAGKTYCFTVRVRNACPTCTVNPGFELRTGGISGTLLDARYSVKASGWYKLCGTITPTATGSIELDIITMGTTGEAYGVIDDIMLSEQYVPIPDFTWSPDTATCEPVQFTSADQRDGTHHSWSFGDGTGSSQANPLHRYRNSGGTFKVRHTAYNGCGSKDTVITIVVKDCCCKNCKPLYFGGNFPDPCGPTMSELTWRGCDSAVSLGNGGYTVTDDASEWNANWEATDHTGDGSNIMLIDGPTASDTVAWKGGFSTRPNSTYCVTAWVKNVCKNCTEPIVTPAQAAVIPGSGTSIPVNTYSRPSFKIKVNGIVLDSVKYLEYDSGQWTKLCATFVSDSTTPFLVWAEIIMEGAGGIGNDGAIDDIFISEQAPPYAGFLLDSTGCGYAKFHCTEDNRTAEHLWKFGDGTTSTEQNPFHIYPTTTGRITYTVTHIVTTPCGTDSAKWNVTIHCCCNNCGENRAVNGDFSASAEQMGYGSDYAYKPTGSLNPGIREVTDAHPSNVAWSGTDHTGIPGSRILLVDGDARITQRVWFQSVQVDSGKTYCFSAWVRDVCPQCGNRSYVDLRIGGLNGMIVDSLYPVVNEKSGWTRLCGTYTATSTGLVELDIVAKAFPSAGNDFAIDDIRFGEEGSSTPSAAFTHGEVSCNTPVIFTATSGSTSTQHKWILNGLPVGGGPSVALTFPGPGTYVVQHIASTECGADTVEETIRIRRCCCHTCGPNMAPNWNFSGMLPCFTGYMSDLGQRPCNPPAFMGNGTYTETTDASLWNANWEATDHTGDGSRFMLVDGPTSAQGNRRAWFAPVNVQAGKTYCFRAWVKNICITCGANSRPNIGLQIGGMGGMLLDSVMRLPYDTTWTLLCGAWQATTSGPIEIDVIAFAGMGGGNDFALDDIYFGEACPGDHAGEWEYQAPAGGDGQGYAPQPGDVYPVPVKKGQNLFHVYEAAEAGSLTIEVLSIEGKRMAGFNTRVDKGINTITIDTKVLSSGVYLLRTQFGEAVNSTKFIVIE